MEHLFGPYGTLSPDNIARFRDSEANAVWFHGFDPHLFDRCDSLGARACVEFRTFRDDYSVRPQLRPIGVDGAPIRFGTHVQGICLSQQSFIDERESELRDGLAAFAPDGVWLDYLTYAGWFETPQPDLQESCFCPDCIAEFGESTGVDCADPARILDEFGREWHAHKCDRIDHFGRRFAQIIREARPGTIVGLYACPWYPDEYDRALTRIFAQDLGRLAETFDVITPLVYARKCGRPPHWSAEYLRESHAFLPAGTAVAPIVDVLDFPESLDALSRVEPASGRSPASGVQIFGGDAVFADPGRTAGFDEAVRRILAVESRPG